MQPVQRISGRKEVYKDSPYLLHHINTWEHQQDISTSYTENYLSSISQEEIIKFEEMDGETYESTTLSIGNRIATEGSVSPLPVRKKENVSERTFTDDSSTNQLLNHDSVKAFCCDQREKIFTRKANLKQHKLHKLYFICNDSDEDNDDIPENNVPSVAPLNDADHCNDAASSAVTINDAAAENNSRYSHLSNIREIQSRMVNRTPLKTRIQNTWTSKVWDDWATWRNTQESNNSTYKRVPLMQELSNGQDRTVRIILLILCTRSVPG